MVKDGLYSQSEGVKYLEGLMVKDGLYSQRDV